MHVTLALGLLAGCSIVVDGRIVDDVDCAEEAPGTSCRDLDGERGVCNMGECVAEGCGDGVLADEEECDDGNFFAADGCEADCTYSCVTDADCDDGDLCTGTETCNTESHSCVAGVALVCPNPPDACHARGTCEPGVGCPATDADELLIDADNDGHAPSSLGACGTDCDDTDFEVHEDHPEICGDGKDNNCANGEADAGEVTWYADCDGDGFALSGAATRVACARPATNAATTGCLDDSGDWTTVNPNTAATRDCADQEADAHPGAFDGAPISEWPTAPIAGTGSWDWNCDSTWERAYNTTDGMCFFLFPCNSATTCCGGGGSGWEDGSVPSCGVTERYELCGDELTNSNCPADEFRQQRCR